MKPKTIAVLVVVALFVIILIQNMTTVDIQILFWLIKMPKLVLIVVSVFLGWIIGFFSYVLFRRRKEKGTSLKKEPKAEKKIEAKPQEGPESSKEE
jgi:uncharacterized integral membrane protein